MKASKLIAIATVASVLHLAASAEEVENKLEGVVKVAAFDLPESAYLSEESRSAMKYFRDVYGPEFFAFAKDCGDLMKFDGDLGKAKEIRDCVSRNYFETSIYKDTRAKHPVDISAEDIAGVYTEIFVPRGGVSEKNKDRLLISIHGGAFMNGARSFSHTEAMQVADLGKIKVISPDYRQAPEFRHPSAVDDAFAVYKETLKEYEPGNIGVFGCSSGAMITAQLIAKILQEGLPVPAAAGLFCAAIPFTMDDVPGAFKMRNGESAYLVSAMYGNPRSADELINTDVSPYFDGVSANDPVVAPGDFDEVMSKFPPTLLISGTRDFALSGVLASHQKLTKLGVEADLHVWEGLGHATFAYNPRLPETDEVHQVIVNFFDKHLGQNE
jgi:acetyl esterase/lipase